MGEEQDKDQPDAIDAAQNPAAGPAQRPGILALGRTAGEEQREADKAERQIGGKQPTLDAAQHQVGGFGQLARGDALDDQIRLEGIDAIGKHRGDEGMDKRLPQQGKCCEDIHRRRDRQPMRLAALGAGKGRHRKAGGEGDEHQQEAGHEGRGAVFDAEDRLQRALVIARGREEIDDKGQRGQENQIAGTHASQKRHPSLREYCSVGGMPEALQEEARGYRLWNEGYPKTPSPLGEKVAAAG